MKINKRKVKKLLAFTLSLAIVINFMLMIFKPNIVNAAIDYNNGGPVDSLATGIGSLLSGLVLVIVSTVIKLPVLLIGYLLKILMNSIVSIGSGQFFGDISLEHILFAGYNTSRI